MSEDDATQILIGITSLKDGQRRFEDRMERMEANVEAIRTAHVENGKSIALIEQRCASRGKRISQLVAVVGGLKEDTGVFRVQEAEQKAHIRATWKTVTIVAGAIVGGAAFATALLKLLG